MSDALVAETDSLLDESLTTDEGMASNSQVEDVVEAIEGGDDADVTCSNSMGGEVESDEPAPSTADPSDEDIATEPQSSRNGLLSRCLTVVRQRRLLIGSCSVCLLLGCGLGYFFSGKDVDAKEDESTTAVHDGNDDFNVESKHLMAAILRRSEPLKPLVAFADLDARVVGLGRRLFHEQALSGNGRLSCASCHALDQGGTVHETLPRGVNRKAAQFNAPSIFNLAFNIAYGWEGRFDTLEAQVEDPITRPEELGSSWERVLKYLSNDVSYKAEFKAVFDSEPSKETVATALATFERSLVTTNSKFDQWLAGDEEALNGDEFGGYFLFKKYGCSNCHQGAAVGGTMYQTMGLAKSYFPADSPDDAGRISVTKREKDRHSFRVAPLRNVAMTAPYLHDGRAQTLEEAVAVMLEFQCGETVNAEDVRRLVGFLKTLSGELPDDHNRSGLSAK